MTRYVRVFADERYGIHGTAPYMRLIAHCADPKCAGVVVGSFASTAIKCECVDHIGSFIFREAAE